MGGGESTTDLENSSIPCEIREELAQISSSASRSAKQNKPEEWWGPAPRDRVPSCAHRESRTQSRSPPDRSRTAAHHLAEQWIHIYSFTSSVQLCPSTFWCCWLDDRKSIRTVRKSSFDSTIHTFSFAFGGPGQTWSYLWKKGQSKKNKSVRSAQLRKKSGARLVNL